jgi:hypothetical protein
VTPGSHPVRRTAVVTMLATACLAAAGCSALPDGGPVVSGSRAAGSLEAQPFDYNPPGPRPGALPDDIVSGFLSAQQAVPVSTRVAEEYLTADAAATWRPDRRTIVYTSQQVVARGTDVVIRLRGTSALDATGRWRGEWSENGRGSLRVRVEREGQEWRIVDPPPALVIPRTHFESRYQALTLSFFDPTGSILVPEPVYLPTGVQAATRLVAGLLQGPPPASREVERSYLPIGTDLGVGVPIRGRGIAEVPLGAEMVDLRPADLNRALAQLTSTLGQLPEVRGVRVLVDGTPLSLPGGEEVLPVTLGEEYSPTVAWASPDLFGLSGRSIVRLTDGAESTVAVLPRRRVEASGRPRSLGVSLAGDRTAVVSGDGTLVWRITSREGADVRPTVVGRGTDLLRPMWDRTGRLWVVDRGDTSRPVTVVSDGDRVRLTEPELRGVVLEAAAVSRDGSRFVVLARLPDGEVEARLFRVVRDDLGAPLRLDFARTLPAPITLRRPRAIGWWDPTTVAVMTRPSGFSTRVQLLPTDGATVAATGAPRLDLLFESGQTMAASPGSPQSLLVGDAEGNVFDLGDDGRWAAVALPGLLRATTYAG